MPVAVTVEGKRLPKSTKADSGSLGLLYDMLSSCDDHDPQPAQHNVGNTVSNSTTRNFAATELPAEYDIDRTHIPHDMSEHIENEEQLEAPEEITTILQDNQDQLNIINSVLADADKHKAKAKAKAKARAKAKVKAKAEAKATPKAAAVPFQISDPNQGYWPTYDNHVGRISEWPKAGPTSRAVHCRLHSRMLLTVHPSMLLLLGILLICSLGVQAVGCVLLWCVGFLVLL